MKKLLVLLFCLAFAAAAADARTLYVDASRPNNNGNGLKLSTAKKTIQAAINIANAGDTILVYPGLYAPIKTNDKKITIKSVKGASTTRIARPVKPLDRALAQLGKTYTIKTTSGTRSSAPLSKGSNTWLVGFLLDGLYRSNEWYTLVGLSGGKAKSCIIQRLGATTVETTGGSTQSYNDCATAAAHARLVSCIVRNNKYMSSGSGLLLSCTLERCKIQDNSGLYGWGEGVRSIAGCKLYNCLLAGNSVDSPLFTSSEFLNCTIVANKLRHKAKATKFSVKSKYWNCILRNNYSRRGTQSWALHNVDAGNTYSRTTTANPKFANYAKGDYRLLKGSVCIDKGALTDAQKKLAGTVDLGGGKRIKGKAVDQGCYEY